MAPVKRSCPSYARSSSVTARGSACGAYFPRSGVARETSQVLGKVFTALRSEGARPADVAREPHLRPADLNDLIFGLVVTAQEGEGQQRGDAHNRPQLSVVR
jgi:hypothetical protein